MRFFLPRRRQCRDGDMAEEGEEKDLKDRRSSLWTVSYMKRYVLFSSEFSDDKTA